MEAIPEFAGHKDLLARNVELLHGLLQTLADLGLVAVDVGAVDVAVAGLQRVLHGTSDLTGLRLPGAQTQDGEIMPARQLDNSDHI